MIYREICEDCVFDGDCNYQRTDTVDICVHILLENFVEDENDESE